MSTPMSYDRLRFETRNYSSPWSAELWLYRGPRTELLSPDRKPPFQTASRASLTSLPAIKGKSPKHPRASDLRRSDPCNSYQKLKKGSALALILSVPLSLRP